jgi:RimJ/RimL family protein N-acetyltransferase
MTDWNTGTANFGHVLRRSAWGQGYATEAGRAVSDWALGELGLRRLVAHCEPCNIGSKHVLGKVAGGHAAVAAQLQSALLLLERQRRS